MVIIAPGNYSVRDLNDAIVAKINYVYNQGEIVVSAFDARTNSIGIRLKDTTTVGVTFQMLTDSEFTFPVDTKRSMNGLLKNFIPETFAGSEVYRSGFVDMYPLRNIYLTCSGLGNFNTMSVSGDRNIIKKIPVTVPYGEVIYYESATGLDYLDCSRQTLSRISFQFKDIHGNVIDLKGAHISFSVVSQSSRRKLTFSGS